MKQILTQIMAQTMIQMLMKKMPFLTAFQITEYKLNELYSQKKLVCFKKISVL